MHLAVEMGSMEPCSGTRFQLRSQTSFVDCLDDTSLGQVQTEFLFLWVGSLFHIIIEKLILTCKHEIWRFDQRFWRHWFRIHYERFLMKSEVHPLSLLDHPRL